MNHRRESRTLSILTFCTKIWRILKAHPVRQHFQYVTPPLHKFDRLSPKKHTIRRQWSQLKCGNNILTNPTRRTSLQLEKKLSEFQIILPVMPHMAVDYNQARQVLTAQTCQSILNTDLRMDVSGIKPYLKQPHMAWSNQLMRQIRHFLICTVIYITDTPTSRTCSVCQNFPHHLPNCWAETVCVCVCVCVCLKEWQPLKDSFLLCLLDFISFGMERQKGCTPLWYTVYTKK